MNQTTYKYSDNPKNRDGIEVHVHVSRNALCPCGSMRKFKHCCLHDKNGLTAPDRTKMRLIQHMIKHNKIIKDPEVKSMSEFLK